MENLPKLRNYRKLMSNHEELPYTWERDWGCASENFPWHIYLVQNGKAHRVVSYQTKTPALARAEKDVATFLKSDGFVLVNNWLTDETIVVK